MISCAPLIQKSGSHLPPILSRRQSGVFFKCADKVGVVVKPAVLTHFGNGFSLAEQLLCQRDPLQDYIFPDGASGLFLKLPAKVGGV